MAIHIREGDLNMAESDFVLAFDPGRDKSGFAFVDLDGGLIASGIFPTSEFERFLADLSPYVIEGVPPENAIQRAKLIIIGNGTLSREFSGRVESVMGREVMTVDERNTTLEARGLYWRLHRPGILMRILPEGMRVPGRVLDDLAAWAVALRGLKKYRDISGNKL